MLKKIGSFFNKKYINIISRILLLMLVSIILFYVLELSNHYIIMISFKYIIINIFSIFTLIFLFRLITQKYSISCAITSILLFILGFSNYYSIEFRDLPVVASDIYNANTAVNVLKGYDFVIGKDIIIMIVLFFVSLLLSFLLYKLEKKVKFKSYIKLIVTIIILIITSVLFCRIYLIKEIVPKNAYRWNWKVSYYEYGYFSTTIQSFINLFDKIKKPNGYSVSKVNSILTKKSDDKNNNTPDIILILNESFYDISKVLNIKTNIDYFEGLKNIENLTYGYSVYSQIGTSTNKTEYELLTSNSLELMPDVTPFVSLNLNNANSIVSHLKNNGYETVAMHPETGSNYQRNIGYKELGFDSIYFKDDLKEKDYYGNRPHVTDESLYKNAIDVYNSMSDKPRFVYLLTMQNHGGWRNNTSSQNIVKVQEIENNGGISKSYFGNILVKMYGKELDEYLTSVYLSGTAFKKLTDYYKTVDREVIILMVGDHSPSLINYFINKESLKNEELIKVYSTPYMVWSNKGKIEFDEYYTSMIYLIPELISKANIKSNNYYNYLTNLSKYYPIMTSFDLCGKSNELKKYNEIKDEKLNNYFYMEYNNVLKNRTYNKYLFE